jgi:hypothetical protein
MIHFSSVDRDAIQHLDSGTNSKAMEMPSADFRISGCF